MVITNKLRGATQDVAYAPLIKTTSELKNVSTIFFGVSASQADGYKDFNSERTSFVPTDHIQTSEEMLEAFNLGVLENSSLKEATKVLIHIDLEAIREADGVTEL